MPVIAVVNRKGGSGKSTLATHLAAHYATRGVPVMLGDVDRQQSTQSWLRARSRQPLARGAPIVGWAVDPKRVLRPPAGVQHVVLDTPGGLRGFDLARVVAFADVILMPVGTSLFDRESAADCHAEMMAMPRVASGRCKLAAVAMRVDARTRGAEVLAAWAEALELPFLGVLRESQSYVRTIERGLSVFDLPAAHGHADVAQWQPVVEWLEASFPPPRPAAFAPSGSMGLRTELPNIDPVVRTPRPAASAEATAAARISVDRLARPIGRPEPSFLGGLLAWWKAPRPARRRMPMPAPSRL
jgi:chromosome partitioning protein